MDEQPWKVMDYGQVYDLYDRRFDTHKELLNRYLRGNITQFVQLALGIEDNTGNYSAAEHGLGQRILATSSKEHVFNLAKILYNCDNPRDIPTIIHNECIKNLGISVGSEISMMLKPDIFWVTNVRTVWAHLIVKHNGNISRANEALYLYKSGYADTEMDYQIWSAIYNLVGTDLDKLYQLTMRGNYLKYLWADAVADTMYNQFSKI